LAKFARRKVLDIPPGRKKGTIDAMNSKAIFGIAGTGDFPFGERPFTIPDTAPRLKGLEGPGCGAVLARCWSDLGFYLIPARPLIVTASPIWHMWGG
jgi:hypothetical protein